MHAAVIYNNLETNDTTLSTAINELYTTKLSQKYNVLGLVMTIDKDENCKIIDAIYQKNKDTYYTQLHLPRTVLTAGEYIDIMSRL